MAYARSPFGEFRSYLRNVVGIDEDDIRLILKQDKSNFVTCEIVPGLYSIKDFSEAVHTMGGQKGTL